MKIIIHSEEELIKVATEALHILNNLRRTTKDWKEHYGSDRRQRMFHYEEMADTFLERLNVDQRMHGSKLNIEINHE